MLDGKEEEKDQPEPEVEIPEASDAHKAIMENYKGIKINSDILDYVTKQLLSIPGHEEIDIVFTAFKLSLFFKNESVHKKKKNKLKQFFTNIKQKKDPIKSTEIHIPESPDTWDIEKWINKLSENLLSKTIRCLVIPNIPNLEKDIEASGEKLDKLNPSNVEYRAILYKFHESDTHQDTRLKRDLMLFHRYSSIRQYQKWKKLKLEIQRSDKQLPPITIKGESCGVPGLEMRKVDDHDPMQCIVGQLAASCQSLTNPTGRKYVIAIMHSPDSALFSIFKPPKKDKEAQPYMPNTVAPKDISAFMMTWVSTDGYLVIDSIEMPPVRRAHLKEYIKLINEFSIKYMEENSHIRGVLMGAARQSYQLYPLLPLITIEEEINGNDGPEIIENNGENIKPMESVEACETDTAIKFIVRTREKTLFSDIIKDSNVINELSPDKIYKKDYVDIIRILTNFGAIDNTIKFLEKYIPQNERESMINIAIDNIDDEEPLIEFLEFLLKTNRKLLFNEETMELIMKKIPKKEKVYSMIFNNILNDNEKDIVVQNISINEIISTVDLQNLINTLNIEKDKDRIMKLLMPKKDSGFCLLAVFIAKNDTLDYILSILGERNFNDLLNAFFLYRIMFRLDEKTLKYFLENEKFNGSRHTILMKNSFDIAYAHPDFIIRIFNSPENTLSQEHKEKIINAFIERNNRTLLSGLTYSYKEENHGKALKFLINLPYFPMAHFFLKDKLTKLTPLESILKTENPKSLDIITDIIKKTHKSPDLLSEYIDDHADHIYELLNTFIEKNYIKSDVLLQLKQQALYSNRYDDLKTSLATPPKDASHAGVKEYVDNLFEANIPHLKQCQLKDLEDLLKSHKKYRYIHKKTGCCSFFSRGPSEIIKTFNELKQARILELSEKRAEDPEEDRPHSAAAAP